MSNNQPVGSESISLAMNGVITMAPPEEWGELFGVQCFTQNDAEIFVRLMERGSDPEYFVANMKGSFAGVFLANGHLWALRNNRRPLYIVDHEDSIFVVSTRDIAERALGIGERCMIVPPNTLTRVGQ
jgi:glutamine phosphoribosylpyrophosphate amidotransferase